MESNRGCSHDNSSSSNHLFWEKQIRSWEVSGKSARAWCRDQGINYSTFTYWKSKLSFPNNRTDNFIEIKDDATSVSRGFTGIEILCNGVAIKLYDGFDEEVLLCCVALFKSTT